MKVDSSMFTHVDYNAETHVLSFTWKASGKVTYYYDVPEELWEKAQSAESIGKLYNAEIKGRYDTDETRAAAVSDANKVNIIPSSEKGFDGSKSKSNDEDVW